MTFSIKSLPASEGDALWIEWGNPNSLRRMIIDMGRQRDGKAIRERLADLGEGNLDIELLIITHVDRDHIEGVLEGFVRNEQPSSVTFKDVWFNGWNHLHGLHYSDDAPSYEEKPAEAAEEALKELLGGGLQPAGAYQGEQLTRALERSGVWNKHFDGKPVVRPENALGRKILLDGGLSVQLLGPTQTILTDFITEWAEEIRAVEEKWGKGLAEIVDARVGPGRLRRTQPHQPRLNSEADLQALANRGQRKVDKKPANGSSICVVLEYEGKRVLMTGDAHADNLIAALQLLPENERYFDLVKLPHHGSAKNVTADLVKVLKTPRFLISTSGSMFYHPDAEAIARIVCHANFETPQILFNVPSTYNGWWDNAEWKNKFGYETAYGTQDDGLTISF